MYSGGTGRPYLVEGVGEDFWPTAYDPTRRRRDHRVIRRRVVRLSPAGSRARRACWSADRAGWPSHPRSRPPRTCRPDDVMVVLLPGRRPRLPRQDLQRQVDAAPTASPSSPDERTVADVIGHEDRRPARPRARASERHRARRHRDHDQVRRLAAAGADGRAARRHGRGGRRASTSARCSSRVQRRGADDRPGRERSSAQPLGLIGMHESVGAARERARRRPTPCSSPTTASRPPCVTRHDLLTFLSD